jgi:hypothetical protein
MTEHEIAAALRLLKHEDEMLESDGIRRFDGSAGWADLTARLAREVLSGEIAPTPPPEAEA